MKFRLEIRMDNAAFENDPGELGRILTDLGKLFQADRLPSQVDAEVNGPVFDFNGNKVGEFRIVAEP